jgi:hypothetical protein
MISTIDFGEKGMMRGSSTKRAIDALVLPTIKPEAMHKHKPGVR